MYRKFYELCADPFCLDPDLDFLFLSRAHEEAVSHIAYGLEQEETVILITGDIGTGKTLALHRVIGQLSAAFSAVVIGVTTIDFAQFMRLVMFKLGDANPPHDVSGLLNAFELQLLEARKAGRKVLLVIDEAQDCDELLLESIRLLLNLAQPGSQVLQLLLVGQIGLEDKLDQPGLRQFRQRIRVSYRLECLNRSELEAYVRHRLRVAGRATPLFSGASLDRIFELSGGVPRLVNQFASRALLAGYVENARSIKPLHVEAEQQTDDRPVPTHAEAQPAVGASTDSARIAPEARTAVGDGRDLRSEFATRRARKGGRALVWIVVGMIAVVVGAATFPQWAPRLGLVEGAPRDELNETLRSAGRPAEGVVAAPDDALAATREANGAALADSLAAIAEIPASAPIESTLTQAAVVGAPSGPAVAKPVSNGAAAKGAPNALPRSAVESSAPAKLQSASSLAAAASPSPSPADESPTSVHVFSFTTTERADVCYANLASQGLPAFGARETGADGRTWYRIYLGPFAHRAQAKALVDSLTQVGAIQYHSYSHKLPNGL